MPNEKRASALIVSGFLGSGKTTLVRHLLADAQRTGTRVAVITNEFGELGIDRALLGAGDQAYVELEGGCICCLIAALVTLPSLLALFAGGTTGEDADTAAGDPGSASENSPDA